MIHPETAATDGAAVCPLLDTWVRFDPALKYSTRTPPFGVR
jgi:hypothetical protein